MKKKQIVWMGICACLMAGTASAQSLQLGTGETDGYRLVWQDLFDDGVLNETDHWSVEVNGDGGGNNELQYYCRENIEVGRDPESDCGCLIITARKESYGGKTCTSGRLTTQGKMSFKHGKLEARIKLPYTANGLWPAFWMLGSTISSEGWPRCGEVDILEMGHVDGIRRGTQDRYFNGACHWGYYENGGYPNYARATTNAYSMQGDFHLFTLIWDETQIAMYLDRDLYPEAEPYYLMSIDTYGDDKSPAHYFHRPFFVIFNLAVGGNFPQLWDIAQVTALDGGEARMYVDYVRLYQKGTDDEEFAGVEATSVNASPQALSGSGTMHLCCRTLWLCGELRRARVFTSEGQEVCSLEGGCQIDLSECRCGVYVVCAEWADGSRTTERIYVK